MRAVLTIVLLMLTAYRATRLVTRDTFPPVLWLRDRLAGGWRPLTLAEHEQYNRLDPIGRELTSSQWAIRYGDDEDSPVTRYVRRVSWSPAWLSELLTCPWCASAYISGALTAATDLTAGLPVPWLVGPAVWAVAALVASKEWA